MRTPRIGLDFDNTLICYDDVFRDVALAGGLLPANFSGSKQEVRDAIRLLSDGERRWQELQGYVYGAGICGARHFPGVASFLRRAREAGAEIVVISHKTQFGHFDPKRVDLRAAALGWMRKTGFFEVDGGGLREENIHFAETRAEKLGKIGELDCTLFVDDLEEVLEDPDFPPHVARILFSPAARGIDDVPLVALPDWPSIEEHVFGERSRS